jgi:hypothetical protein
MRRERIQKELEQEKAQFNQSQSPLAQAMRQAQLAQAAQAQRAAEQGNREIPWWKQESALRGLQAVGRGEQPQGFDASDMATVYGPKGISEALKAQLLNKGKTDVANMAAQGRAATQDINQTKVEVGVKKKVQDAWDKAVKDNGKLRNASPEYRQWFDDSTANRLYPDKFAPPATQEPPPLMKKGELDETGMPKTEALASTAPPTGDETSPFKLATVNYDDRGNVIPSVPDSNLPNTNPGGDNVLSPGVETPPPVPMPTPREPPVNNLAASNWTPTEIPEDSWGAPQETPRLADNQWTPQADDEEERRRQEILMAYLEQYQDFQEQDQQYG